MEDMTGSGMKRTLGVPVGYVKYNIAKKKAPAVVPRGPCGRSSGEIPLVATEFDSANGADPAFDFHPSSSRRRPQLKAPGRLLSSK